MTEIEMLERAEAYTFVLMDREDKENEIFRETHGHDDPIHMNMINSYWDDIFDIWEKMKELKDR